MEVAQGPMTCICCGKKRPSRIFPSWKKWVRTYVTYPNEHNLPEDVSQRRVKAFGDGPDTLRYSKIELCPKCRKEVFGYMKDDQLLATPPASQAVN